MFKSVKKLAQELDRATVRLRLWISQDRVADQGRQQFERAVALLSSGVPS